MSVIPPMVGGMVEFQMIRRRDIAKDGRVAEGAVPHFPFGRTLAQVDAERVRVVTPKPPYAGKEDDDGD